MGETASGSCIKRGLSALQADRRSLRANHGHDGMAFRQGVADDQPRSQGTGLIQLAPDLRLDGVLCSRKHVACGRRTRYVLRTRDSELHPSRVNALKHFFGRSSVALRDAKLL
jgi:hypothetical protein